MDISNIIDEIGALMEQKQYGDAIAKIESIPVHHISREEQEKIFTAISSVPTEIADTSMILCYDMVILSLQRGNISAARKWHSILMAMREQVAEKTPQRTALENRIACAALCMPLESSANMLLNLAVFANEFENAKIPLAKVSATGKTPSVLRGAKDLSPLAKHYNAAASIVRPLLGVFTEDDANGVCEAAIAEVLYEHNDINGAAMQVAGAINAENPEILFVALTVRARIGLVDPSAKPPEDILKHTGEMLEGKRAHWLMPNYRALCTRLDILRGNTDKIRAWLAQCTVDDFAGVAPNNAYELMTKAKAYIALEEYRNAALLLESLTIFMQKTQRTMDLIECYINSAIVCARMGSDDVALSKLEQALLLAQEYNYIRLFADHGKPLHQLITRYAQEEALSTDLDVHYIQKITEAAAAFAQICPAIYAASGSNETESDEELTQSEVQVLRLLDEGKTNKTIAKELHIQPSTVNFHLKNIFVKLGASNRTEAVKKAREKSLVS